MTKAKHRSPERAALAEAIEVRKAAEVAAKAADDALNTYDEHLSETRRLYFRAEAEKEEAVKAKDDLLRMYGGSVRGVLDHCAEQGLPHPEARLRSAEAELIEAGRNRDLGEEGQLALRSAHVQAQRDLFSANEKARNAINGVELTRISDLLDAAGKVQADYQRYCFVLDRLVGHFPFIHCTNDGWAPTDPLQIRLRDFQGQLRIGKFAALAPWEAARDALWNDADAVLPE